MRNILKYKFILLTGVLFMFATSCDDGLGELNVDPNNPVDVPASNLVTQAQYSLYNNMHGRTYNAEWTMLMVQHWAQNEYAEDSRYVVDGNSFDTPWQNIYAGVLNELKVAKDKILADKTVNAPVLKGNQVAIIDVLTVSAYHMLVDGFGNIPYTQALNSLEFPLPVYDGQDVVYKGMLASLESAIGAMDASTGSFGGGDIVYGGDMNSWKKLANSLMMRIAMRIVDVDAATAGTYINQAAGNVFTSNADNAYFVFSDDPSLANPLYIDATVNNRDDFCISKIMVDNMVAMGDPRLEKFAAPTNTGDIVGMPYGLLDGEAFALKSTSSRPTDAVRAATAPHVIMDYAEVAFLTAEAIQRGILTGDAAAAYANGVTASMNYWGIDDQTAIDAYVAANAYDASKWKESLGWQKWIAFYMNGPQAWAEWRRLDQPSLPVPAAADNSSIPVRLPYPISEETRNGTSLKAVGHGINDLNTKLWWDVN